MGEKIKISSIIIAFNEEANINRCIESQLEICDDIVVLVDSKTSDATFKAASSYSKVNCEIVEWMGYAKTKTYAVSKTKYDWILWIDADEQITPELAGELKKFKEEMPEFNQYDVARRAFFLGKWIKHSGWYPARVTRLFNKKFVSFSEKEVHEHLIYEGEIGHLKNDLNHFTDPTVSHYFVKFNNYTSLAAKELNDKGKRANINDIVFRPLFIFIKMYILRLGFMDGLHGFVLALFSSLYVFTKYVKLWELNRTDKK